MASSSTSQRSVPPSVRMTHLWPVADQIEWVHRTQAQEITETEEAPIVGEPEFRGAALEAQTITAPEWMLAGPSETGKTFGALWRLDQLLNNTPNSTYGLVRK